MLTNILTNIGLVLGLTIGVPFLLSFYSHQSTIAPSSRLPTVLELAVKLASAFWEL